MTPPPPTAPTAKPAADASAGYEVLLAEWTGADGGFPPWDKVEARFLEPAVNKAGELYLAEIKAIADSTEPATFENTLVAMERAGKPLDRVLTVYSVMSSSLNTPEVQKASEVIEPKLSEIEDAVHFDSKLFARVKSVYDAREKSELSLEQRRLVEKTYDDFVRRGAQLDAASKARLGAMNQELAKLFTDFGNRVQADEDTWVTLKQDELGGLPESLVKSFKAAAEERKVDGWVVVNTRSAVEPFLSFSDRRDLRKKVWQAFVDRGDHGDAHDTNDIIKKIVKLRAERAKLLGYKSHAHWRMSDTMAKDPKRAEALMMRVWPAAVGRVKQEVADMQKLANKEGKKVTIEPWDYRYYMEKVRKQKYALDQNEFKNYFALENMIKAAYYMAEKLYGYAFEEITGKVPVFHPDVRVYRVTNKKDGSFVGILYRDDFARQYKRSGAWQDTYRTEQKVGRRGARHGVEQQQLLEGRQGRARADQPGGRPHAVSRVRPRAARADHGHHLPVHGAHAAGLRGVPQPGARKLGADSGDLGQVRAPREDRGEDAAGADRQDAGRADLQSGLRHGGVSERGHLGHEDPHGPQRRDRSRRFREEGAEGHRHAQANRAAAPAAAVHASVHVGCVLGGLLQLPVVRRDGRGRVAGFRRDEGPVRSEDRGQIQEDHLGFRATPSIAPRPTGSSAGATPRWKRC